MILLFRVLYDIRVPYFRKPPYDKCAPVQGPSSCLPKNYKTDICKSFSARGRFEHQRTGLLGFTPHVRAEVVTYSSVMKACDMSGEWQLALALFGCFAARKHLHVLVLQLASKPLSHSVRPWHVSISILCRHAKIALSRLVWLEFGERAVRIHQSPQVAA